MNKAIYRQADSRWGSLSYPTKAYSFAGNGCGCCACLHVLIEQDKYKNWTPKDLRPYMVDKGFATKGHGTTWAGIKLTLEHYGNKVINHGTMNDIFKTLNERKEKKLPCLGVILFRSGSKGGVKWTAGGHYVAFVDYKVSNSKHYFYTKDSGGRHHDGWYCYETQMKGLIPQIWSALPKTTSTNTNTTAEPKSEGYSGTYPTGVLKKGSTGTQVKNLQKYLNWYGNYGLSVDGSFGNKTLAAVKDFQKKNNLVVDGVVGVKTINAMQAVKKNVTDSSSSTPSAPAQSTKDKGMDISAWQGNISVANFKKAKEAGIKFVILRIGYTGIESRKPTLDSCFENNYKNAKAAGLKIGYYYYSTAINESMAQKEAEFTIAHIKDKQCDYPVYIDIEDPEYQKSLSKSTLAAICNKFCVLVKQAGYKPGVYASLNWFNNKIGNITAEHSKWVAQYNSTCNYKGTYDMWQYSSSENVPGIASKTDVNWCYKKF